MKTLIVEKNIIDLKARTRSAPYFALATQEPVEHTATYSLTYEAYLTEWRQDRKITENLQSIYSGRNE